MRFAIFKQVISRNNCDVFDTNYSDRTRVHKFTINKTAKMNHTMYETITNCNFVFMKKMVIPVNTVKSNT